MESPRRGFDSFAETIMPRLRPLALAMCADPEGAEVALQVTMERLYRAWPRLSMTDPVAYARAAMLHNLIGERRRPWWRMESPVGDATSEVIAAADFSDVVDERLLLLDGLRRLPPRQRHALVLRYLEEMSVGEVASLMGCSEGSVKRSSHDGLQKLKKLMAPSTERHSSS